MKTWDLFAGKHGDLIGILVGILIKTIDVGAFKIQDPKFSQCIISEVLAVAGWKEKKYQRVLPLLGRLW